MLWQTDRYKRMYYCKRKTKGGKEDTSEVALTTEDTSEVALATKE